MAEKNGWKIIASGDLVPPEITLLILCVLIVQYYRKLKSEMTGMTDMELSVLVVKQVMGAVGGLYCADLLSGITHMIFDHFIDASKTSFLSDIAKTFQEHHDNPKLVLDSTVHELYSQVAVFVPIPIIASAYHAMHDSPSELILANIAFVVGGSSNLFIHRETHNYNHNKGDGTVRTRVYGILSDMGLVMSSEYHKAHHVAEKHDINFPTINGWSSPLMNFVVRTTGILDHVNKN